MPTRSSRSTTTGVSLRTGNTAAVSRSSCARRSSRRSRLDLQLVDFFPYLSEPADEIRANVSPLMQSDHLVHGLIEPRAELGESHSAAGLIQGFFDRVRVGD